MFEGATRVPTPTDRTDSAAFALVRSVDPAAEVTFVSTPVGAVPEVVADVLAADGGRRGR